MTCTGDCCLREGSTLFKISFTSCTVSQSISEQVVYLESTKTKLVKICSPLLSLLGFIFGYRSQYYKVINGSGGKKYLVTRPLNNKAEKEAERARARDDLGLRCRARPRSRRLQTPAPVAQKLSIRSPSTRFI